jgi:hypothetical protein
MAVNVNKTKFIIFHTKGKNIDPNITKLTYNDNEPNSNNPDLIYNIERYHNNHAKPECRSYKLLGIHFDENLSFDYHTNYLCNKINRSLFCINRAKNSLTPQALITLYYALIQSHLSYCPTIVSCANTGNISKISKLQKKAIRIINCKKYNDHTAPIFKRLKILPYEQIIRQAKLKMMHSVTYNYAPPSFRNIWPRNIERNIEYDLRNNNMYTVPNPRIEQFKKSPLYSFAKLWNDLNDIKLQQNKKTFQIALKDYLLSEI